MTGVPLVLAQRAPGAAGVAVGLLCIATVAGPLALGATGPWPQFGLEAAMAVSASLWAVSGGRGFRAIVLPLAIAGLFLLQLVPLPDSVLVSLAPVSAGRWKVAREGLEAGWATVSVDPAATAAAIRRLLLGLAAVAAVASLGRTAAYRRWLYTALAVSAAAIWAAAFVFPVDPENRAVMGVFSLHGPIHFWMTPDRAPLQTSGCGYLEWVFVGDQRYQSDNAIRGDGFGSYIYSNHFANALCLTLPALWAMWMMLSARWRLPNAVRFGVMTTAMAAACWTTGVLANSRAGTASLAFAAIVYLALVARSRWLRWPAAAVAAVVAAGLVGFVATCQGPLPGVFEFLPETLQAKLVSLLVDTRVFAAKVAGRMFLAAPLLGTGLGTYGDLYPALVPGERVMFFAHNEYAQLLGESGLLGVGLLAVAALTLGWRFLRFCRERPATTRQIDAGAWAAVAGVAAHSVFDWGMHAPANAFLACIVTGLALSSVAPRRARTIVKQTGLLARVPGFALGAACLAVVPLLARDAFTAHTLDVLRRATTAARVAALKPDSPPPAPLLRDAILAGSRASRLDLGDWQLAALLAQANLHLAQVARNPHERQVAETAVTDWTQLARRASAVTRGLPEPLPPSPQ
jgi:O-antigen ligase